MKSILVKLKKKDFETEIEGKKVYQLAGFYYCAKCGYAMKPQVLKGKQGFKKVINIFLDMACQCEQLR